MPIIKAMLGAVLLFFGRSFYWAFVAVAGFLVGGQFAELALADQAAWVRLLAALAAGGAGALLAIFAQRFAFALGGLYAGGYLALFVAQTIQSVGNQILWFVLGGVIGAVIAALIMDWAIIVLSSLVGASAIVTALAIDPPISVILYLLLVTVGVLIQAKFLWSRQEVRRPSSSSDV